MECQDGTNHPVLSNYPGDKGKVVPLRGAAVSDRAQVLAWCSLSHVGVVLLAASTVMDRAGTLYPPAEDWPSPLSHMASSSHELADWNLCSQRPSAVPLDAPLLGGLWQGVDSTCLTSSSVTRLQKPCLRFVTHSRGPLHFYF